MLRRVAWQKLTEVSQSLMMEAVSTSETSDSFYQATRRNNVHARSRYNLKCHAVKKSVSSYDNIPYH
jgi:hypothetical protein